MRRIRWRRPPRASVPPPTATTYAAKPTPMLNVAYASRRSIGPASIMNSNSAGGFRGVVDLVDERLVQPHQLAPAVAGDVRDVVRACMPSLLALAHERHVDDRRRRAAPRRTSAPSCPIGVMYPCGSRSAICRHSVSPFVCTPEQARKMIASPSCTSPTMRSSLRRRFCPTADPASTIVSGSTMPLQRRRLAATPHRAGRTAPFGEPVRQIVRRVPSLANHAESPDGRVHRHRDRQRAARDQVVDDRRDGVDADLRGRSSCPSAASMASATRFFVPSPSSTCAR